MLSVFLLVVILGLLATRTYLDRNRMKAFKALEDSAARRRAFLRWTSGSFMTFGIGGLAILLLIGRADALLHFPVEFEALQAALGTGPTVQMAAAELAGVAIGILAGGLATLAVWRFVLGKRSQPVLGDVASLFPRNAAEALSLIPLSINAGVSEELFFRIALPLLAMQATGSALAGFVIASVTFGLMHWYQGWKGVVITAVICVPLISFYLSTGSILVPMMVHALIDLMALVIRPSISLWLDRAQPARAIGTS